jgi:hypothetical protein
LPPLQQQQKLQTKTGIAALPVKPKQPVASSSATTAATTPDDMPTNWKLLESLHNFEGKFNNNNNFHNNNNNQFKSGFVTAAPDVYKINAYQTATTEEVYYDLPRGFGL